MPGLRQNAAMDVNVSLALLGGLSPAAFARRFWHKRPLLVRQAWPGVMPPLSRSALFGLASSDDVESRLVDRSNGSWRVRSGPLPRRSLPPVQRPGWTLLVQGLDLHVATARAMLDRFRFLPDARLDDLMVSWASAGGGVGPHLDSYDVFLLQVQGRRRWRVGAAKTRDAARQAGLPLKILRDFVPAFDWELAPGDMLYLPPGWAHDGVAVGGDCITCSVGFRAPAAASLAAEILQSIADGATAGDVPPLAAAARLYGDPQQPATPHPAAVPPPLAAFARQAVERLLDTPGALDRALGEVLSGPKPRVWFESAALAKGTDEGVQLARATRMLYDERHVFINGESYRAAGRDARLMRRLADQRWLGPADCARLGEQASGLLDDWLHQGWLVPHAEGRP